MTGSVRTVESRLGYSFKDASKVQEALTHSSYANEDRGAVSNERLEYLGDAVLELCVSEMLYLEHPHWDEGKMTRERSRIVRESSLAEWARGLGVDRALRVGRSLAFQHGTTNASVLADAMEAIFGALYLDGGLEAASAAITSLIERYPQSDDEVGSAPEKDPKTRLQELLQARGSVPPKYELVARTGPGHASTFEVELIMPDGRRLTRGRGPSKKSAEFEAAQAALELIDSE